MAIGLTTHAQAIARLKEILASYAERTAIYRIDTSPDGLVVTIALVLSES